MSDTHTTNNATTVEHLRVATILYDALMAQIEPELTMENVAFLSNFYDGETSLEAKARLERYEQAFKTFAELWTDFIALCELEMTSLHQSVLADAKKFSVSEEKGAISSLEDSINAT